MDDYEQRGGMAVTAMASKRHTLKEFCVASNHDQLIPGGPNITNNQSLRHNDMSCWQTIALLERPWRLPAPNGLPDPNFPASVPVTFGTACGSQRVVLLLDRSGSEEVFEKDTMPR